MAGVAIAGALLSLIPPAQQPGRDMLRYGALAAVALAAWKVLDPPGANALVELRRGALACVVAAIVLVACGSAVAAAPLRRRAAARGARAAAPQRG
jgi:hypothetical protein